VSKGKSKSYRGGGSTIKALLKVSTAISMKMDISAVNTIKRQLSKGLIMVQ
jgi:hypothetical protein